MSVSVVASVKSLPLCIMAARWQGMSSAEMVASGSGQVLAIDVDIPGVGWP
ncbi:MAG TPA: hypothetical protein VKU39_06815 [Streptosporangiaceae bacterium]|nr:hypothetical protein [Streptosporangiaceae bacterium]